jgi:hypothetical protein
MVLQPGFEPGSVTREATILDRTILPEHLFAVAYIPNRFSLIYFPLLANLIKNYFPISSKRKKLQKNGILVSQIESYSRSEAKKDNLQNRIFFLEN